MKGQTKNLMMPVSPEKLIRSLKSSCRQAAAFYNKGNNDFEYMPYLEVQDEPFTCFP